MTDARAILAARNNADWYAMMFELHGLRYHRAENAFLAIDPPPPYHSWITTLDPAADQAHLEMISRNLVRPGFGVKDSFQRLELSACGLVELFSATWIWAGTVASASTTGWQRITSREALVSWEAAWQSSGSPSGRRQFPAAILSRPDVAIWGRRGMEGFDAGAIANRSQDCVGLSNCFGRDALPAAAALCAGFGRELAVVGYERADGLAAALDAGFEAAGPLRVWCKPT